jgi:hypothetical protein
VGIGWNREVGEDDEKEDVGMSLLFAKTTKGSLREGRRRWGLTGGGVFGGVGG